MASNGMPGTNQGEPQGFVKILTGILVIRDSWVHMDGMDGHALRIMKKAGNVQNYVVKDTMSLEDIPVSIDV